MHPLYLEDLEQVCRDLGEVGALRGRRVLVTGVTGMIGACLVDALSLLNERRGLGMHIVGVSRHPERFADRFPGAELLAADLTRPDPALPEADLIVHAASNAHPAAFSADPVGTMLCNLRGTEALLEQLRRAGHGRLLFVSTGEIYGDNPAITSGFSETDFGRVDPMNPRACYPESKRAAETLCASYAAQYGVDALVARLCHVYGPTFTSSNSRADAQFIRKALAGEDIVMKSMGGQVRSFCYVADAVSALLTLLAGGGTGQAYNVANRASVASIRQYAETLADIAGVKVVFDVPPEAERAGYTKITRAVLNPAKLEGLGWTAKYDLRRGLEETYRCCKQG